MDRRTVGTGQQHFSFSGCTKCAKQGERVCVRGVCVWLSDQTDERGVMGWGGYCCCAGTVPLETALSSPWNNRRHDSHTVLPLANCAQHFYGVAALRPRLPYSSWLLWCFKRDTQAYIFKGLRVRYSPHHLPGVWLRNYLLSLLNIYIFYCWLLNMYL